MSEGVWDEPGDGLVHYFRLVVDPLDREEHLAKAVGMHNVQLPFVGEARAVFNDFSRKAGSAWEGSEEEDHTECVVDITKGVDKGWVARSTRFRQEDLREIDLRRTAPL